MRLFVTVNGRPAIIVGYAPTKDGSPLAIVIGLAPTPSAVSLSDCILPELPRKLRRKIKVQLRNETQDARREIAEAMVN